MARLKTITTKTHERDILSVSELNARAKSILEQNFFQVWVEAEISNLTMARSGHWYFTLKDDKCQVSCAMFRGSNVRTQVQPADGIKVRVRGKVSLYEPRGNFQLIVDHMEAAGVGDLLRQFEELKQKLSAEGLFAPEHKRPISDINKRIGVITSATGAAIHDVLSTIERRFPLQEVILYPSLVQGAQAAANLRQQLAVANERKEVDVILLVRGGGAIEDLWSFNDEQLARDIFASDIPIVSGVGHEVDVTIADFVADLRAATPTAAAEHTTQDQEIVRQNIQANKDWLMRVIQDMLQRYSQQVDVLNRQLANPEQLILRRAQQVENLRNQLGHLSSRRVNTLQKQFQSSKLKLLQQDPLKRIQLTYKAAQQKQQQLSYQMKQRLEFAKTELVKRTVALDNLSPLKVLARGYSVTMNEHGKAIINSQELSVGETIISRLHDGQVVSQITDIKSGQSGK